MEKRNVWKFVDRSEIKLVDCDNALMRASVHFSEYSVEDGWDLGHCVTYAGTLERITLAPACMELPPFPDGDDDE
ncbi:MAG: hypothetical protein GY850_47220 [bacterium]|nr:hypothetical protein [bacterium]